MKKLAFVLMGIALAGVQSANSQNSLEEIIVIVKPYEATVSDAYKISIMPEISDTIPVITKFSYYTEPNVPEIKYTPQEITAAKVTGEPIQPLYHTYLKAGAGNYTSFLGEAGFNVLRNKEYTAGFFYKHQSSMAKIKLANDYKSPAQFSDNAFTMGGEKFMGNKSLYGTAWFERNVFHYYGFNPLFDTTLVSDAQKQRLMDIGTKIGIKSYFPDSASINYDCALGYNFFENIQGGYQNHVLLDGKLSNFYKKELLMLNVKVNYYNKFSNLDTVNNGIVHLNPAVRFFGDKWRIETGIVFDVDAYTDSLKYHYYPSVFLQYNVIEDLLIPYFGFGGGILSNDFKTIARDNPFTLPGLQVKNTNNLIKLNLGFKGRFSRATSFNISGAYGVYENMFFFLPDSNGIENKFNVVYDNVQLMQFRGEFSIKKSEKLNIFLTANYYHYSCDSQAYAWHKPVYDATLAIKYNLKNKIIAGLDVFNQGETYSKIWHNALNQPETISVKSFIDVSLNVEYRYTKVLSFYVNANNLIHRNNYYWSSYPVQRFNIMGGLSYMF